MLAIMSLEPGRSCQLVFIWQDRKYGRLKITYPGARYRDLTHWNFVKFKIIFKNLSRKRAEQVDYTSFLKIPTFKLTPPSPLNNVFADIVDSSCQFFFLLVSFANLIVELTPARKLAVIETEERLPSDFLVSKSWILDRERLEVSKIRILNESARAKYQTRAVLKRLFIELINQAHQLS